MSLLKEVKLHSTLCEHNGFIYLSVPNDIINAFVKMIPDYYGKIKTPNTAIKKEDDVGAHISVIRPEELKRINKKIREIGEIFEYTIDKMYVTEPKNWEDVKEVYFISVKSLQLESLRKKYGLRRKYNGHDFHITVAIEKI